MKFFRTVVPNLSVSLSIALIVTAILDYYNPLMGFLQSTPSRVLIIITALFAIAGSLASYIAWRSEAAGADARAHTRGAHTRRAEEAEE